MLNNSQIANINSLSTKQSIACQMSSSNGPNSPSTLTNIKCEAYVTSPKEETNTKPQDILEEKTLNLRECDISPTTLPNHVQKNNKYIKSTRSEVSPKPSENTNSISSITKNEKISADTEDVNNENKSNTKRSTGQIKETELDKPLTEKSSATNTIAKDNDDVLSSLGNIKKEEANSPQLSPGPFDTIESGNPTSVDNVIHGKFNEKNGTIHNQKERLLGAPLNSEESPAFSSANNNQINENNPQYLITSNNSSNFMQEFMQQQNHIFVFSTQLANKGAESVINGHFPTIIAYHCMQPATKNFLEDFFLKNPMKVTKLQRQNSMNFCNTNMQANNSVQWLNMCNSKIAQNKQIANKNLPNVNSSIDNIKGNVAPSVRNNTYSETHDNMGNENEFICWDPIRQSVEGDTLKMLDAASILRNQHSNKSIGFMESNDNNIPSLQGVKVPDENLTPQQRQHREEQLAKLKKMNQFLFPENGSEFKVDGGGGQSNMGGSKVSTENVPNILLCNQMNAAQLNIVVQNASGNGQSVNPQLNCNTDNITATNDEHTLPAEIIAVQESGRIQNNINKGICSNNTPRNNLQRDSCTANSSMSGPNGNTDLINELNHNNIPTCPSNKNIQPASALKMEENHVASTQLDWTKPQNQFYDERKNKLSDHSNSLNPTTNNHSLRCGNQNNPINTNTSSRNIQGPPPPYHSTQRSASVPIVQSPNPSSPTNPTSNLSLPSPHTSVGQGNPENSPSLDVHSNLQSSLVSNITPINSTTCGQTKTSFHQEGSPSNINRNRSGFSQLNSNPSTPMPNMSPKEVESYPPLGSAEFKNLRVNRPQTPRSPITNQSSLDQYNTENRFNSASPVTSFCQTSNSVNPLNVFKTGTIERQTSAPSNSQFGRRPENLPLNPNSARVAPSKPNASFDPISSLAQMSQQLTNCTPHNQHIGPNSSGINIGGMSDMNLLSNNNLGLENSMNQGDSVIDNCGGNSSATLGGMISTHGPGASLINNNCHQIMGPMGQRLLNPKLCGNFHQNANNLRDGHANMHPIGPVPRLGGSRMQMNFNNYNVSPNIQVKASTPNTIQYMPVRPQNTNNSLRPPPSLEFLQRYANPQMTGNMMDSGQIIQGNSVTNSEQHKFVGVNSNGNPVNSIYQNCNQSNIMNLEQDELQHGTTVSDMNMGASMRGSRSMRQHPMQPRMHNINTVNQTYASISQDSLECGTESTHIYNNMGENVIGQSQNFTNTQQKPMKTIGQSISHSASNTINNMTNPTGLTSDHVVNMHPTLGNTPGVGINSSGNNLSTPSSINNNGYKYIGPTPNDLKYAQQYHSFQQQLYATSTRNPHGSTTNVVATNSSTNPNFFVNK